MTERRQILDLVVKYYNFTNKKKKFYPGKSEIPVSGKVLDSNDIKNLVNSSLDGWLTSGRYNKKFEREICKFIGCKLAITVNSGSSANLVAFSTLTSEKLKDKRILPGDEVIATAAAFPTTVNPILMYGAVPVFVDIDLKTLNVNVNLVEKAITEKTKAIMIAHSLGNPYDLEKIKKICEKHNLWLIEDCCDALGSTFAGKHVGTFGDLATLSFYPAHHITMGEGGLVFTDNIKLKRIAESFRDWGRDCYCEPGKDNTCNKRFCWKLGNLPEGYDHKYTYSHMGFNLKITDMQAACGLSQLKKLKKFIYRRKSNFKYLYNKFKKLDDFFILPQKTKNSDPSWFGFPLTIKSKKINRNELLQFLNQKKIGTRLLFSGNIIKQPYMLNQNFKISGNLDNTNQVLHYTFWLGVYPGLGSEQLNYIFKVVSDFIKKTVK